MMYGIHRYNDNFMHIIQCLQYKYLLPYSPTNLFQNTYPVHPDPAPPAGMDPRSTVSGLPAALE